VGNDTGGISVSEPGKRATPRQARSEQTVEAILRAADSVFATRSVDAATTTMIAKEAGLSVGALYRFYEDKNAIALALTERYTAELSGPIGEVYIMLDEHGTAVIPEVMQKTVDTMAALCKEYPGYFSVMRHLRGNKLHELQIDIIASFFAYSKRDLAAAEYRRLALFVSEVSRSLLERTPSRGKARREHLDQIVALLVPYLQSHLD